MQTPKRSDEVRPPSSDGEGARRSGTLRLRPPRNRVDRRAISWWTAQALLVAAPPVVVLAVPAFFIAPVRLWLGIAAGVVALLGLRYVLVMPLWRYRIHRWETTEEAVYAASGWLWHEWRVAPIARIQTVDTERGPLQRMFGLSTVTVTTASAAGAIKIEGLDHELAAEVVEQLTEKTQAAPGDAT